MVTVRRAWRGSVRWLRASRAGRWVVRKVRGLKPWLIYRLEHPVSWFEALTVMAFGLALLIGLVPLQRALAPKHGPYHPWWEIPGLVVGGLFLLFGLVLLVTRLSGTVLSRRMRDPRGRITRARRIPKTHHIVAAPPSPVYPSLAFGTLPLTIDMREMTCEQGRGDCQGLWIWTAEDVGIVNKSNEAITFRPWLLMALEQVETTPRQLVHIDAAGCTQVTLRFELRMPGNPRELVFLEVGTDRTCRINFPPIGTGNTLTFLGDIDETTPR